MATKKHRIPGLAEWSMHAGGVGAAPGKHGYELRVGDMIFGIGPYTTPQGRHAGYRVTGWYTGLGAGYVWIDAKGDYNFNGRSHHRTPQAAVAAVRKFYDQLPAFIASQYGGLRRNAPTDCTRITPTFNRYQGKQVSLYGDSWVVAGCDDRTVRGEGAARLKSKTRTGKKGRPIVKVVAKRRLRDAAFQGRGGIKPRKRTRR